MITINIKRGTTACDIGVLSQNETALSIFRQENGQKHRFNTAKYAILSWHQGCYWEYVCFCSVCLVIGVSGG